MTSPPGLVTADHLDLLVTAAVKYRLLITPTAMAFTDTTVGTGTVASPTEAAALLLEEQIAALRWHAGRGCQVLEIPIDLLTHRYRPIELPGPVQVIKACHAYQHLASASPGWSASAAHRLVEAIIRAATCRLPGYSAASWHWRRAAHADGAVIGLRRAWTPLERGVTWLDPAALRRRWDGASHALITLDALPDLPEGLAPHPRAYVLAGDHIDPAEWQSMADGALAALVMLPPGLPWLLEQLATPAGAP